jgi:hypothetical protein
MRCGGLWRVPIPTTLYSFIVSGQGAEICPAPMFNFAADSGHGGRTRDQDGDEIDGWDEGGAVQLKTLLFQLRRDDSHLSARL